MRYAVSVVTCEVSFRGEGGREGGREGGEGRGGEGRGGEGRGGEGRGGEGRGEGGGREGRREGGWVGGWVDGWVGIINLSSPPKDATSSLHFNQDFSKYSFINLATYLRALESSRSQAAAPSAPPILLTRDLMLWEAFLRKLKGHSEVLRDRRSVTALLEVLVTLFQYTIDYQVERERGGGGGGSLPRAATSTRVHFL